MNTVLEAIQHRIKICLGVLCILGLSPAMAIAADEGYTPGGADDPMYTVAVEQLADGVYAMVRHPSTHFGVQGTALVIVNDNDVIVLDGAGHPYYTRNVIREIRKLTDKPVSTLIISHWHQDHNRGAFIYADEFPGIRMLAHERTKIYLDENDAASLEGIESVEFRTQFATTVQERLDAAVAEDNPEVAAWYEDILQSMDPYIDGLMGVRTAPINETITSSLTIHRGDRIIEVKYLGLGNTAGDIVVWLPNEKILATGDLIVRPTPYGLGTYVADWGHTVTRLLDYPFEKMVPGHGAVMDSKEARNYVTWLSEALEYVNAQARIAAADGIEDAEALTERLDFTEIEAALNPADPVAKWYFKIYFKDAIAGNALKQARGELIYDYSEKDEE